MREKEKAPGRCSALEPRVRHRDGIVSAAAGTVKTADIVPFRPRADTDDPTAQGILLAAVRTARRHTECDGVSWLLSARQGVRECLLTYTWPIPTRASLRVVLSQLNRLDVDGALRSLAALEHSLCGDVRGHQR